MTLMDCLQINPDLVFLKLHYFFLFGGLGGFLPYATLIGKSLNINATAIGLLFTAKQCVELFSKPSVGYLVDFYKNMKLFLMGLIVVVIITGLSVLLIPPITDGDITEYNGGLEISNSSEAWKESPSINETKHFNNKNCTLAVSMKNASTTQTIPNAQLKSHDDPKNITFVYQAKDSYVRDNFTYVIRSPAEESVNLSAVSLHDSTNFNAEYGPCANHTTDTDLAINVYSSYQFWIFALLYIIQKVAYGNTVSLSDVACYGMLKNQRQLYGSQRLFGTIGWALMCLLSGFLNQVSSEYALREDFSPGTYLMGSLLAVDFFIVSKMPIVKSKCSRNITGDIRKVMSSREIRVFAAGVVAIGMLSSAVSNYEFWYLQDLGASQGLMGAMIFVQCAIELPFFIVSSWFINKLGSTINCLVLTFVAYSVRCGLYYLLQNPLWALAIDTTHGLCFALFHTSMTRFASEIAPEGTEATVLSILAGLNSGLGAATGSLLSGVALDKYGGRLMFGYACIFSTACGVFFFVLSRIFVTNPETSSKASYTCSTVNTEENGSEKIFHLEVLKS